MTEKKAIKFLDNLCLKMTYEYEVATHSRREVLNQEYSAVFLAKEALEKQIPRKVKSRTDELFGDISICCPNCENTGIVNPWNRKHYFKYCPDCGQALDWSEEE